jgi:amino acid permease
MIQRIQTVYLLIVAGLFMAVMFLPIAVLQSGDNLYSFEVTGLNTVEQVPELAFPTWSLMAIAAIIILLAFVIIFMYKKRLLQIRMCIFNALLMIGFCALVGFYLWQFGKSPELPDMKINIRISAAFPLIAIILDYLAIRNIGADEALIRSLERLR